MPDGQAPSAPVDDPKMKDKSKAIKGKKTGKKPGKGAEAPPVTRKMAHQKANILFPVAKIAKALKKGGYANRLGAGAPVYMAAVMEYITAEILELAGNAAQDHKKQRILPRHIQLAVRNDEELSKYLGDVTIAGGGVMPNIHSVLLPQKNKSGSKDDTGPSQEF